MELDPLLVRPLGQAQNEFIQVLLSNFQVRRAGSGLRLEVEFGYETPAIWLRRGKAHVRERSARGRVGELNTALKRVLLGGAREDYVHSDPEFPFRFGSGGALPVVHMGGEDYYCLFYRDTHPVGWNIANGGAESAYELLDPLAIIERELREELIIVDPDQGKRYVFDWSEGRRPDHPEFAVARRVWERLFSERDTATIRELALPLKWLPGPDSVRIRFEGKDYDPIPGCVLNINAEDFAIETDRVAKLSVEPGAVFCHGEVIRGELLNRIVGLFSVRRLNAALLAGAEDFHPDKAYWTGRDRSGEPIVELAQEYLADIEQRRVWAKPVLEEWREASHKFGLCPVTDTLIRRYLMMEGPRAKPMAASDCDVFLSFSTASREIARQVFDYLQARGQRVFFSDELVHQTDYGRAIDDALGSARALVVVGMTPDELRRRWVEYEWRTFHQDILGYRKPENTPIISITASADPETLPRPLASRQVIPWDRSAADLTLSKLGGSVWKMFRRADAGVGAAHHRKRTGQRPRGDRNRHFEVLRRQGR